MNKNKTISISFFGCALFFLGSLFFIYEYFVRTSLDALNAMPDDIFTKSLNISTLQLSLIGGAYSLSYSVMQIPVGVIVDRFGIRKTGSSAIFICTIGVLIFTCSYNFISAFFGRLMIGFGSAFAFILLLKILLDWFPHRVLGFAIGITQILGVIGPILSNIPLAYCLAKSSYKWRTIFYLISCIGIILNIIFLFCARDKILNNNPITLKKITNKILLILKYPQIIFISIFAFFIYPSAELFGSLYASSYLVSMGYDPISASSAIQFIWLGMGIGSPILGLYSDLIKNRKIPLCFAALIGIISSFLIIYLNPLQLITYYVLFFLLGFATGAQAISFSIIVENSPLKLEATAMAFNNMSVVLGTAFIQILGGFLLHRISFNNTLNIISSIDYRITLSISTIFFVFAFLTMAIFVKETRCERIQ